MKWAYARNQKTIMNRRKFIASAAAGVTGLAAGNLGATPQKEVSNIGRPRKFPPPTDSFPPHRSVFNELKDLRPRHVLEHMASPGVAVRNKKKRDGALLTQIYYMTQSHLRVPVPTPEEVERWIVDEYRNDMMSHSIPAREACILKGISVHNDISCRIDEASNWVYWTNGNVVWHFEFELFGRDRVILSTGDLTTMDYRGGEKEKINATPDYTILTRTAEFVSVDALVEIIRRDA